MSDPYKEGRDAFDDDCVQSFNPYPMHSEEWSDWDVGWYEAQCDCEDNQDADP